MLLSRLAGRIEEITLISRDALALKQSAMNLAESDSFGAVRQEHIVALWRGGPQGDMDLFAGVLNDKEGVDVNLEKILQVRLACAKTPIVAGCSSSLGFRLRTALAQRGVKSSMTKGHRGMCVIVCG